MKRYLREIGYGLSLAVLFMMVAMIVDIASNTKEIQATNLEMNNEDLCTKMGTIASDIMTHRQVNTSIDEVRKLMKNQIHPMYNDTVETLIKAAYKQPIVKEEDKVNAVIQFSIVYMSSCFSILEKQYNLDNELRSL